MPASFTHHYNLEGLIEIKINYEDDAFAQTLNRNFDNNQNLLKNLSECIKALQVDYENISNRMNQISNIFLQLNKNSENSNEVL